MLIPATAALCRVRGQVLVAQEDQPLPPEPDVHDFHASGSPGSPATLCSELHRQVCQVRYFEAIVSTSMNLRVTFLAGGDLFSVELAEDAVKSRWFPFVG